MLQKLKAVLKVKTIQLVVISSLLMHQTESEPMIDCLQMILQRHFQPESSLVFLQGKEDILPPKNSKLLANSSDPEASAAILKSLFLTNTYSITLERAGERRIQRTVKHINHDGYILFSELEDHHLAERVSKMRHYIDWNPRAKFIILMQNHVTYTIVSDIFSELWRWKVINVIIICRSTSKDEGSLTEEFYPLLDVYAWFPFDPVEHCGSVKDPVLIDRWILKDQQGQFLINAHLFPPKVPRNMKGCLLRVSTFEFGPMMFGQTPNQDGSVSYNAGIEHLLMKEIAKITNMTLYILPPPPDNGYWGVDLGNGTWNGLAAEVITGFSDIGAVGIWYKCHILNEMECSAAHMIDKIRWYVPCAKSHPKWSSLTRVFKVSLWGAFVAVFVAVAFCMWAVVIVSNYTTPQELQNQAYSGIVKCLVNFWAIILEESASNDPPEIMSIRSLFLAWVLYCYAVNTVYQTFLTSFLVDPGLQKQISSEVELLNSGIVYWVFPATAAHDKTLLSNKYPKMQFCLSKTECLDGVAFHDRAFVFSQMLTEYEIAVKYMNANGDRIICDFEEIVSLQLITLPVMKGDPKLHVINQVIRRVSEAGLVDKWFDSIKYLSTLALAKSFNLPPGDYIKLSMDHLQSAFYFMFLGHIISALAFTIEILSKKKVFARRLKKIKGHDKCIVCF